MAALRDIWWKISHSISELYRCLLATSSFRFRFQLHVAALVPESSEEKRIRPSLISYECYLTWQNSLKLTVCSANNLIVEAIAWQIELMHWCLNVTMDGSWKSRTADDTLCLMKFVDFDWICSATELIDAVSILCMFLDAVICILHVEAFISSVKSSIAKEIVWLKRAVFDGIAEPIVVASSLSSRSFALLLERAFTYLHFWVLEYS